MNIRAGLGEYILQTHNTNFFEDSMGGLNPSNPPLWVRHCMTGIRHLMTAAAVA